MTFWAFHVFARDALGPYELGETRFRKSRVDYAVKVMGVFRHYKPSFAATIFSTLKMAVELANAASASYAIASNGLCR
jgi:hypothetical protein